MSRNRLESDIDWQADPPPVTSPIQIPDTLLWFDAFEINGAGNANPSNGATVSTWVDKSAGANNFTAIDPGALPVYQANGFRGLPTVRIDSTMDGFEAPTGFASGSGGYTIFFVGQQLENNVGGFNAYLLDMSGTQRFLVWLNDDNSPGFYFQNAFQGGTAIQDAAERYATWKFDQGNTPTAELRLNGVSSRTDANFVSSTLDNPLRIGSRFAAEDVLNFDGFISEFLIYDRGLTAQEILQVEEYLRIKWGF